MVLATRNSFAFDKFFDDLFDNALGFQEMIDSFRDFKFTVSAYPPYDIYSTKTDNGTEWAIDVALAGFSKDEIEVKREKNILTISGSKKNSDTERVKVHSGISHRAFKHQIPMEKDVQVKSVVFENGLLTVHLERPNPIEDKAIVYEVK